MSYKISAKYNDVTGWQDFKIKAKMLLLLITKEDTEEIRYSFPNPSSGLFLNVISGTWEIKLLPLEQKILGQTLDNITAITFYPGDVFSLYMQIVELALRCTDASSGNAKTIRIILPGIAKLGDVDYDLKDYVWVLEWEIH